MDLPAGAGMAKAWQARGPKRTADGEGGETRGTAGEGEGSGEEAGEGAGGKDLEEVKGPAAWFGGMEASRNRNARPRRGEEARSSAQRQGPAAASKSSSRLTARPGAPPPPPYSRNDIDIYVFPFAFRSPASSARPCHEALP